MENQTKENKLYKILLNGKEIGVSNLENGDVPMGTVFGVLNFIDKNFGYSQIKEFWKNNHLKLATDYPEDRMISTMSTDKLQIINQNGIEIKGIGNQITGVDNKGYEISIFGIPYLIYEDEFSTHVKDYNDLHSKE